MASAGVSPEHWKALARRDLETVCRNAGARYHPPTGVILSLLTADLLIDLNRRSLRWLNHGRWEGVDDSFVLLLCLVYLLNAKPYPLTDELVSVQDLKCAHFFHGPHELKVQALLDRYGDDVTAFTRSARHLGATDLDLADVSFKMKVFPKVPMVYLLWKGNEEFGPSMSILFDRSIEHHLPADAIWGLTSFVSKVLLLGNDRKAFQERI
jgi:hypothetical protein